jgi:S1-C subfamily serine protease
MVFTSSSRSSSDNSAQTSTNSLSSAFAKLCFGAAAVLASAERADAQLVSNVVRSGPASPTPAVRLSDPVPASLIKSLAAKVTPATVALAMRSESGRNFGSGTIIDVRPEQFPVLMKNEVLVATAAHLFSDWGPSKLLTATVYGDYDSSLKPKAETDYPARVIGRLMMPLHSTNYNDIALVAIQLPEKDLQLVLKRAAKLPERNPNATHPFGEVAVTVGCPGARNVQLDGKEFLKPALPIHQDGRILQFSTSPVSQGSKEFSVREIRTIADPKVGHSGGGLFNESGELIGICSGGAPALADYPDFPVSGVERIVQSNSGFGVAGPPPGSIVVHSEEEHKRAMWSLVPGWAKNVKTRGNFSSTQCVYELMDVVTEEFQGLQRDVERVDAHYSEWLKDSEGSFILPVREANHVARIKRAWEHERTAIEQKLRGLKPDYE